MCIYNTFYNLIDNIRNIIHYWGKNFCYNDIYLYIYNLKKEPVNDWSSVTSVYQCFLKEKFHPINTLQLSNFQKNKNSFDLSYLIIEKKNNMYRIIEHDFTGEMDNSKFIPNLKSYFIFIEYNCPGMKYPIKIELNKEVFIKGNHILSCTFLMRYFTYNYGIDYKFDQDYTLTIIDNNVKVFSIKRDQYIEINEFDYEVKQK
jgi:hypothetical protein